MPVIYKPSGKALEYSDLACNLYTGCSHKCKYCYCPSIMRKSLDDWGANPHPRTRILKQVEKDALALAGDKREVLFSFMTDPYQSDEAAFLTRQALLVLEKNRMKAQVLTKAGFRAVKDFDILARNGWKFGSTIIFRNEELRKEWEPGTPSISSRYEAVKIAHAKGIYTWVSVEPVVDTMEALSVISDLRDIVDFWKIGKLNHFKAVENQIDWAEYLSSAKDLLRGKSYYIKNDLVKFGNEQAGEHEQKNRQENLQKVV